MRQCIVQRKQTLLSLGNLILETQSGFFLRGPGNLRAFSQAEAAELLNVHESTVSRALRGKYLQCSWGIFPLQHFFSQGLAQRDEICHQIRKLVENEDKRRPLSDQALCDALTGEGFSISRRMVSKYRENLNIPGAGVRRKYSK
ncbi:MAG: hypothetical protein Q4F81_07520 [Eubacteriales bacterium]|nr:hypothetical protein [Eubacteriales bacterium]